MKLCLFRFFRRLNWFWEYLVFAINSNGFSIAGIVVFIIAIIYLFLDALTLRGLGKEFDSMTREEQKAFEKKSSVVPILLFSLALLLRIIGFIVAALQGNQQVYEYIVGDLLTIGIVGLALFLRHKKKKSKHEFLDDVFGDK